MNFETFTEIFFLSIPIVYLLSRSELLTMLLFMVWFVTNTLYYPSLVEGCIIDTPMLFTIIYFILIFMMVSYNATIIIPIYYLFHFFDIATNRW